MPTSNLPMNGKLKAQDPAFREVEYIGVDEVKIEGTPTGRRYHFGEDPEKIMYWVHYNDLNYLRALGLLKMRGA